MKGSEEPGPQVTHLTLGRQAGGPRAAWENEARSSRRLSWSCHGVRKTPGTTTRTAERVQRGHLAYHAALRDSGQVVTNADGVANHQGQRRQPEFVAAAAWPLLVVVVVLSPESLTDVEVIVPPLPWVPWIVTESPGRTEWLLTSCVFLIAVLESSLAWTVAPEASLM